MAEKPTFHEFLDDLLHFLRALPYGLEHIGICPEGEITVR
jgi:hypothetical protein